MQPTTMALSEQQEQWPEFERLAQPLPDDVKTKIIINSNPSSTLYPAICVNRACRDTLWADPRQLRIQLPVDLTHRQTNIIASGVLRTFRRRADLRREMQEQGAYIQDSHSISLQFGGNDSQSTVSSGKDLQTARIGLILYSMEASSRDLITRLCITTDFDSSELHLPMLPSLTQLHLDTKARINSKFFSLLDLPQLQELTVWAANTILVQHTIPPKADNLQLLSICPNLLGGGMLVADMPHLPALTKLYTSARLTLAELVSLTSGPLPNLEELVVDELVFGPDEASMQVTGAGDRLGALQRVFVSGQRLSLTLAARLRLCYNIHVSTDDVCGIFESAEDSEHIWPALLYVGQQDADLDPADPLVDAQIAEFDNLILPSLIKGPKMWEETTVHFPQHLVLHMIQVLGPQGLLPSVQLMPQTAQELSVQLRHLKYNTPASVPLWVRIVTALPQQRVAALVAQCWPELPRDSWSYKQR